MKHIFLIAALVFSIFSNSFAQNKIERLTFATVDTTGNEKEQLADIYGWITNNISYDSRSLSKKNKSKQSPEQTIIRKKAVCYGYAELAQEMCEVLNIESYVVHGYTKGFGYLKGDHFTRANHVWNIARADSNWIIIDPTWGSGGLNYTYNMKNKFLKVISKEKAIRTKLAFNPIQTNDYFDVRPEDLTSTHFPIDSKWQLRDYPLSYHSFIYDSTGTDKFLNFRKEIAQIRKQEQGYQFLAEAKNSRHYNHLNEFDLANAYYMNGCALQLTKNSVYDSTLLIPLFRSIESFDSSMVHLRKFRTISREQYNSKRREYKVVGKQVAAAVKWIKRIPTIDNNRYFKAYGKLQKNDMVIKKSRLNTFSANAEVLEKIRFNYDEPLSKDTIAYQESVVKCAADSLQILLKQAQLTEITQNIKSAYESGEGQNDLIISHVLAMSRHLFILGEAIDSMAEYAVIKASQELGDEYNTYKQHLQSKSELEERLSENLFQFQTSYQRIERYLYSQLSAYERLARITGENQRWQSKANRGREDLHQLYLTKLEVLEYLEFHNESWKNLLIRQDKILAKLGAGRISNIAIQLNLFYDFLLQKYANAYAGDMNLYEKIRNDTKERKKALKEAAREVKKQVALLK